MIPPRRHAVPWGMGDNAAFASSREARIFSLRLGEGRAENCPPQKKFFPRHAEPTGFLLAAWRVSPAGGRRNPEGGSERLLGSALYRIAMFDVNGRLSERSSEVFGVAGMFGEVAGGSESYVKSDN